MRMIITEPSPIVFLRKDMLVLSVLIVSLTEPPTMGMIFPTKNFAVLAEMLSCALESDVCTDIENKRIIIIKLRIVKKVFFIKFPRLFRLIDGAIDEHKVSAIQTLVTAFNAVLHM